MNLIFLSPYFLVYFSSASKQSESLRRPSSLSPGFKKNLALNGLQEVQVSVEGFMFCLTTGAEALWAYQIPQQQ
ncbi:MAG: hypothetical protein HC821_02110 [Lewinella sp.]|nr:hypothetical protein [Lewinella sp.]